MRIRRLLFLAGLASAQLWSPPSAGASDWPQWRGPDRSNFSRETGLLQEWPTNGPPLAWQISGLGLGISPVSVANGRVYTVGNRDGAEYAYALDAATGEKLWATRLGATIAENALMRWLTQRSPTIDGERLYTFTAKGELFCLNAADGRKLWQKSYAKDFSARRSWGYCDYPLVDGENLICTPFSSNATVVAFNKHNGEMVWKTAVEGSGLAGYGATVVSLAGGIRQYVLLVTKSLVGIAADDGRVLWTIERANSRYGGTYTPIVAESRILSVEGYGGGLALFNLTRQGDGLVPRQQYHHAFPFDAFEDSTVLVDNHIYAFGARAATVCIELQTGTKIWEKQPLRGQGRAALTYADGRLYMRHVNGVVTLADVSPAGYTEKGSFTVPLHEPSSGVTFPVVSGGRLWIRDNDRLFAYDVRTGKSAGKSAPPRSILLSLTERERQAGDDAASATPRVGRDRPPDAIYIPTPHDVVEHLLDLAAVKKDDVVYDLGSGDGRIVIAAAKKYGSRAVGYEIDERLVRESRENVQRNQLASLVRIEHGDLFQVDLSGADVIAVFLPPPLLDRLRPQFEKLKPGARIVSHQFAIPGIKPEKTVTPESRENGEKHALYLWTAPLSKVP